MSEPTLIYMRNVPGKPHFRALTEVFPCEMYDGSINDIPVDDEWDGSSVPWIFQRIFPRHKHPIASRKHDWRRGKSKTLAEYQWSDLMFEKDIACVPEGTSRKDRYVAKLESKIGYFGVAANTLWHRIRRKF